MNAMAICTSSQSGRSWHPDPGAPGFSRLAWLVHSHSRARKEKSVARAESAAQVTNASATGVPYAVV